MWYSEVEHYNFNKPGFNGKTGHFTQVITNTLSINWNIIIDNIDFIIKNFFVKNYIKTKLGLSTQLIK